MTELLIKLDEQTYAFVKACADEAGISIQNMASGILKAFFEAYEGQNE